MAESLLVSSSSSSTTLSFYCSSGIRSMSRSTRGMSTKAVVVPLCRKPKQRCPSTTSTTATSLSSVRLGLSPTTSLSSSSSFNANSNVEPAFSSPFFHCRSGPAPLSALDSGIPHPQGPPVESETFRQWDSLTAKFSASANIPFLLLQLPQIILNARNLLSGNNSALLAVPWLGMLTGMLGNLSLLSYFAKKREKEAVVVQTLGVVSTYVVITQLAIAEAMPLAHFTATSVVVAAGLVLNFMNYFGLLNSNIWRFWEDFITIGGLSVLPQVMWSTFVPYIPSSILPGLASFGIALAAVVMARMGKLSEGGVKFLGVISGWTATLLFMWMPVSQMWTNFLCPDNIKGLSASTMLLAMIGNGLMIPRALFIRDFMWFTGSAWAVLFYGYGNILCLYCFNCISREFFLAATIGLLGWIGMALWRDSAAYGHRSPLRSVKELVFGP